MHKFFSYLLNMIQITKELLPLIKYKNKNTKLSKTECQKIKLILDEVTNYKKFALVLTNNDHHKTIIKTLHIIWFDFIKQQLQNMICFCEKKEANIQTILEFIDSFIETIEQQHENIENEFFKTMVLENKKQEINTQEIKKISKLLFKSRSSGVNGNIFAFNKQQIITTLKTFKQSIVEYMKNYNVSTMHQSFVFFIAIAIIVNVATSCNNTYLKAINKIYRCIKK